MEVYEGDQLKISITSFTTGKVIAEQIVTVEYRNCKFGVQWGREFTGFDGFTNTTFEVVGTIHDEKLRFTQEEIDNLPF